MYTLRVSNRFKRNFRNPSSINQRRVSEEMQRLTEKPYTGYPLVGEYKGLWCSRVGNIRMIYIIDEKQKIIKFISVKPRNAAYRDSQTP